MAEKVKLQISVFEYTKSGILLLLIIKSLNLKEAKTKTVGEQLKTSKSHMTMKAQRNQAGEKVSILITTSDKELSTSI